jgi:AcrR family transcriptional regulator
MAGKPLTRQDTAVRRRRVRSDALASRRALLNAVQRLLTVDGESFSLFTLTELAAEAGVAVATAYRHFPDPATALECYHTELVRELFEEIGAATAAGEGTAAPARERFHGACRIWVRRSAEWAPAAVRVRSARGILARLRSGDELMALIRDVLGPIVEALVADGELPPVEAEFAVLVWCTLFDERVLCDLLLTSGWSERRVVDRLARSVLGALGGSPDSPGRPDSAARATI